MDDVIVPDGVVETSQGDERAAFCGDQAVGFGVEWPRLAGAAHGRQRREAEMDAEVVGAVDGAGKHEVGVAIVQAITRQLDRVQAAGTRSVERVRPDPEPEGALQQECRQSGREAVAWIDGCDTGGGKRFGAVAGQAGDRGGFDECRHTGRRKREVAKHRAEALRVDVGVAGVLQRCSRGVKSPLEHRIQGADLVSGDGEPVRVEQRLESLDVPAAVRPRPVGTVGWAVAQHVLGGNTPSIARYARHEIAALDDRVPQFVGGGSPR